MLETSDFFHEIEGHHCNNTRKFTRVRINRTSWAFKNTHVLHPMALLTPVKMQIFRSRSSSITAPIFLCPVVRERCGRLFSLRAHFLTIEPKIAKGKQAARTLLVCETDLLILFSYFLDL